MAYTAVSSMSGIDGWQPTYLAGQRAPGRGGAALRVRAGARAQRRRLPPLLPAARLSLVGGLPRCPGSHMHAGSPGQAAQLLGTRPSRWACRGEAGVEA